MEHIMAKRKFAFYDQTTYHLWYKSGHVWRYPDSYDSSKQFHLILPKERGKSITVHCILCSDGRVLYDVQLGGRSSVACIKEFLDRKLRGVEGWLIVHDRLAANMS